MKSEPEDLPHFKTGCTVAVTTPQSMEAVWFIVGYSYAYAML